MQVEGRQQPPRAGHKEKSPPGPQEGAFPPAHLASSFSASRTVRGHTAALGGKFLVMGHSSRMTLDEDRLSEENIDSSHEYSLDVPAGRYGLFIRICQPQQIKSFFKLA